jgi:hypothetical protein
MVVAGVVVVESAGARRGLSSDPVASMTGQAANQRARGWLHQGRVETRHGVVCFASCPASASI